MAHYGFTGTQRGMTILQINTVTKLIEGLINKSDTQMIFHHGDCVGADEQAHAIAFERGVLIHVHPPTKRHKRAFTKGWTWCEPPAEYMVRNRVIVQYGLDGLIAVSETMYEQVRSGTWATVRYARLLKRKPIWIVLPDGSLHMDQKSAE